MAAVVDMLEVVDPPTASLESWHLWAIEQAYSVRLSIRKAAWLQAWILLGMQLLSVEVLPFLLLMWVCVEMAAMVALVALVVLNCSLTQVLEKVLHQHPVVSEVFVPRVAYL